MMARTTITLALAALLVLPRAAHAMAPDESGRTDSMLDVHVGASIAHADALSGKIRDDVTRVLRAHRIELDEQRTMRLGIGVGGEAYAYRVAMSVMRDGQLVGAANEPWICECTHDELLTRISQAVVDLVPTLQGDAEPIAPPTSEEGSPPPPRVVEADAARADRRSLRVGGKVGVGLLAGGLAVVVGGIALAAAGDRRHREARSLEREVEGRNLAPAGFATLGIGAVATVVGAVLLGRDRRRARKLSFAPRPYGFSLATRF